jgi:hypothetical protein
MGRPKPSTPKKGLDPYNLQRFLPPAMIQVLPALRLCISTVDIVDFL